MKKIREWLHDYFASIEGNEMEKILEDVAERTVDSLEEARAQVNLRIDRMISWLNSARPRGELSSVEWAWDPRGTEA